jgi:hypothetical protein
VIELTGDLVPVPPDVRLTEQERVRQVAIELGAPVPDLERIPQVLPPFHALRVDRQDRVWIERYVTNETRTFSVFTEGGEPLATLDIPTQIDTFKPVTFSDNQLYYFTRDGSGWVWLVAMRIERSN